MKTEYVMVRLKSGTHGRLLRQLRQLADAMAAGQARDERDSLDNVNPRANELTVDAFISRLLDQRDRHRARVKAAKDKKRVRVPSSLFPHEGRV